MGRPRDYEREDRLRRDWGKVSVNQIAKREKTSVGSIYRTARRIGLHTVSQRPAPRPLDRHHPAIKHGRPRFMKRLVTAETSPGLFVSGSENQKIGRRVIKGRWAGMPIYTLTLAERMTCPQSCEVWDICYGNNLNWPRRHVLDYDLIDRMRWELTALAAKHPTGFVIRLHILGDFGSDKEPELALAYATAWTEWLKRFPALRVFGFTAWAPETPVGQIVAATNRKDAARWRVRFSGRGGPNGALMADRAKERVLVCPYETKRVENCGACGLCWTMKLPVGWVQH